MEMARVEDQRAEWQTSWYQTAALGHLLSGMIATAVGGRPPSWSTIIQMIPEGMRVTMDDDDTGGISLEASAAMLGLN